MDKSTSFVAIDAHMRTLAIARLRPGMANPEIVSLPNEPRAVAKLFSRWKRENRLRVCYEAGSVGFVLYRQLTALGIACEVIAPALIPKRPGERIKTDRRDARNLVRLYRAGELTPIRVPTPEAEAARDLVRARGDARKDLVAARQRLSKFLIRHGRIWSAGSPWTQRHYCWLRAQKFDQPAEQLTFDYYLSQVAHLIDCRKSLEQRVLDLARQPEHGDMVARLVCYRGIRELNAMVILAEIYDFGRFASAAEFAAFVGLVPSEHSSGSRIVRGGITKTGNAHVRRALIEASWSYRRRPAESRRLKKAFEGQKTEVVEHAKKAQRRLHARYKRLISRGKQPQVAVTAVARELAGALWAAGAGAIT